MFLRRHFIHLRDEMLQDDDGDAVQSAPRSVVPCTAACLHHDCDDNPGAIVYLSRRWYYHVGGAFLVSLSESPFLS
jgi:hypothetical protein